MTDGGHSILDIASCVFLPIAKQVTEQESEMLAILCGFWANVTIASLSCLIPEFDLVSHRFCPVSWRTVFIKQRYMNFSIIPNPNNMMSSVIIA
jgi:hypothetical protein